LLVLSKNLGNIPAQAIMSEEQEQVFTNGINKGRKLERKLFIKLLTAHGKTEWCLESDCPGPFPVKHLKAILGGNK